MGGGGRWVGGGGGGGGGGGARDCLLPLCHTSAAVSDQNNLEMIHSLLFGLGDNGICDDNNTTTMRRFIIDKIYWNYFSRR